MIRTPLYIILLTLVFCVSNRADAQYTPTRNIRGIVLDQQEKPVEFATVIASSDGLEISRKTTDSKGYFEVQIDSSKTDSTLLQISSVNKVSQSIWLTQAEYASIIKVTLLNQSLTLNDVVVSGVIKNQNSASSIIFDEEAIKQLQAFSLMDVLNALPGRKTVAPDLQSPQTINFRTSAVGADAMNNSFGIAIFIDGVRISNETNMQSRSLSSRGVDFSTVNGYQQSAMDVPYNGFDLRDIPLSNIASIEVIRGVGSAKYGDFTNGAILITTKAGKTPYNFSANINGGSTSFSIAKGIELGKKLGAINLSLGYLNSNNDPRDKVKSYSSLNGNLRWTVKPTKNLSNTMSIGIGRNFDDTKADPDDDAQRLSYSKRRNYSISNNTILDFKSGFISAATATMNYTQGLEDSYSQWLLNGLPKGVGNKDTTGVYEGYYIPGNYLAIEHINGKPISYSARVDFDSKLVNWLGFKHKVSFGVSYSGSENKGLGYIVDPMRPRWVDVGDQNERPFSYADNVAPLKSAGVYVQDNMNGKLFKKIFNVSLGFRYDVQGPNKSPQPRVSFNYHLNKNWSTSSSFGASFKSPSLAHLNQAPTYFDIPLLSLYTGNTNSSLYLVYTKKIPVDNLDLKQSSTYQFEQTFNYQSKSIGSGYASFYYKKSNNGFNTYREYLPTEIEAYSYTVNDDQSINYFPTGERGIAYDLSRTRMNNGLTSQDYGVDLMFETHKIKAIATSFNLKASYSYSIAKGANPSYFQLASEQQMARDVAYIEYANSDLISRNMIATITSNTLIPKIGFVFTIIADYEPFNKILYQSVDIYPLSYTNLSLENTMLTREEAMGSDYSFLRRSPDSDATFGLAAGAINLSMRVAKEIREKIRINLSAYNVLNPKPRVFKASENSSPVFTNNPLSITIGANIQF